MGDNVMMESNLAGTQMNISRMVPPEGAPTMAPPVGAPTMAPPVGAPTMAPPVGAPTMAPSVGAPTMAPPVDIPSAAPSLNNSSPKKNESKISEIIAEIPASPSLTLVRIEKRYVWIVGNDDSRAWDGNSFINL